MKLKLLFTLLASLFFSGISIAQETTSNIQMAERFYGEGKIYIVIAVMTIIFLGIVLYLIRLEKKIKKLENEVG